MTVKSLYSRGFPDTNYFPRAINSNFQYNAGAAFNGNISDARLWLNTFTGNQAFQLLFGCGGNELGGNRYEDTGNAVDMGGPNGNGCPGHSYINSSFFTQNSYGSGFDIRLGRGRGYVANDNVYDAVALNSGNNSAQSNSIELGGYGNLDYVNIGGGVWISQGNRRGYAVNLASGFTIDYVYLQGVVDNSNGFKPVNWGVVPAHFVADFVGPDGFHSEKGRPVAIGTHIPLGTTQAVFEMYGTTSTIVPVGTTGQRPSAPINGMVRVNTTTPALEAYYNSTWNSLTPGTSVTWPTTGSLVLSNGTNSPAGIAEVDGNCIVGAAGVWGAGACSGSTGVNLGTSATITSPQRSGDGTTGFYSSGASKIDASINGTQQIQIGTNALSMNGQANQTFSMFRNTTTIGSSLTLQSGGALSGATNAVGGNLVLSSGISTGTGTSNIIMNIYKAGGSGTSDNSATQMFSVNGNGTISVGTTTSTGGIVNVGNTANTPAISVNMSGVDSTGGALVFTGMASTTGSSAGRGLAMTVNGEAFSRGMWYSNGALGIGPGFGTRDVFLERGTTSQFAIDSNLAGGAANLVVSGKLGVGIGTAATPAATIEANGTIKTAGYTVSTLPAGSVGMRAYVTDQLTACVVAGAALTGGGAVTCPVFYNGSAWVGD